MFDPSNWKEDEIKVPLQCIMAKSYWSADYDTESSVANETLLQL
jgi:hypothetical protein